MIFKADFRNHICVLEYPRSGGNWVLKMCSAYLKMPYRTIEVPKMTLFQQIAWRGFNIPPLARFNKQPVRNPFKFLIKTHLFFDIEPRKTIYCLRDGRDVLCSYYYFNRDFSVRTIGKKINFNFNDNLPDPIQFESYIQFRFQEDNRRNFNWVDHIRKASGLKNVLFVRYEDLKKETFPTMCKILEFIGIKKINLERLQRIIGEESFEKEKKRLMEEKGKFHIHLRKGEIGSWREIFTEKSRSFFDSQAAELMHELNYYPEKN